MPIAEYATPSTKELPEAVRKYVKAHDGMLLANHGALTLGADLFSAYYKMETIEHFAKISLVARLLGGERLLSREEVDAAAGAARLATASRRRRRSAPTRPTPIQADCQVVQAPVSTPGERLVAGSGAAAGPQRRRVRPGSNVGPDEEIRLTYRELTALIEDAVKNLR